MGKRKYEPTHRQKEFVKNVFVEKENYYQSAVKAGYKHNTAIAAKENILEKPRLRQWIEETMGTRDWVKGVDQTLWEIMTQGEKREKSADRIQAARAWSELTGAKAAQELEITAYNAEDRRKMYANVVKEVKAMLPPKAGKGKPPKGTSGKAHKAE